MTDIQTKLKEFHRKHSFSNQSNFNKGISMPLYDSYFWDVVDFDVFLPSLGRNLQRDFVWTIEQKKLFILSKIIDNYIPPVTLIQNYKEDYKNHIFEVIDGKQRLSTIKSFLNNEFSVNVDGDEIFFRDSEQFFKRSNMLGMITANVFYSYPNEVIDDQKKIEIFESCSFLGTPQDFKHLEELKKMV